MKTETYQVELVSAEGEIAKIFEGVTSITMTIEYPNEDKK